MLQLRGGIDSIKAALECRVVDAWAKLAEETFGAYGPQVRTQGI